MGRGFWIGATLPMVLMPACLGETLTLSPEIDGGTLLDGGTDAQDAGGKPDVPVVLCAGKDCLGGACVGDVCQPALIATPEQDIVPFGIAVDPSSTGSVYYTTYSALSVLRVDKWGSPSEIVWATGDWWTRMIDVQLDDHRLYFSAYSPDKAPIYAMNDADTTPIKLGDSDPRGAWFVTFDESHVYWANRDDLEAIVRAPKYEGAREVILTKTNPTDAAAGIAIDGQTLYYGMQHDTGGWIGMVNKAGGSPIVLTGANPRALRVEGEFVYWNEPTSVKRMHKDGTGSVETLDTGANIASIGLDGGYVYWTDQSKGELRRRPADTSGPSETLATNQLQPMMIAFDEVAVYWTNQAGGVMKLAK